MSRGKKRRREQETIATQPRRRPSCSSHDRAPRSTFARPPLATHLLRAAYARCWPRGGSPTPTRGNSTQFGGLRGGTRGYQKVGGGGRGETPTTTIIQPKCGVIRRTLKLDKFLRQRQTARESYVPGNAGRMRKRFTDFRLGALWVYRRAARGSNATGMRHTSVST